MELMNDVNQWYFITFKFDGYWIEVQGQSRMRYKGGNQKTAKLERDKINFIVLREQIEMLCPWLRGQYFDLHFHDIGTSPKIYKPITSDVDVNNMIIQYNEKRRIEIVIVTQLVEEDIDPLQNANVNNKNQCLGLCHSSFDNGGNNNVVIDAIDDEFLICEYGETQQPSIGSYFQDSISFKQALRTNAILNNFDVKIIASDKSRVIATCAHHGCPWRVRASLCPDGRSFEVRKLEATHLCPGVNRAGNKHATTSWVAHQIKDIVKKNPHTPNLINSNLETSYGLSLPYMKLWRSREQARDLLFGSIDENYKWVPTLRMKLINRNPGSHITYTYDIQDNAFKRFYVSFKVCSDGFLAGCRYLIGVDACHLKSKYLGVLLSANYLDGNNGLYTIAFAVVEFESKRTWEWFLRNLSQTIGCRIEHLAFISVMEKGLSEAVSNIFPHAEHRVCIRHL